MINIKVIKEEDKGRWVTYTDSMGNKERGKIKSWNDKWIFVVYNCAGCWDKYQDYTAAATDPKDLEWG